VPPFYEAAGRMWPEAVQLLAIGGVMPTRMNHAAAAVVPTSLNKRYNTAHSWGPAITLIARSDQFTPP
jgi:hypothetical protein